MVTRQTFDPMQAESTLNSLNAALDAVQETLRHPEADIFRKPVDHVALKLVDYLTIIPNPVDLGTICKQLEAGRKSNWRRSSYTSAKEVISDSLRVFENCEVYNQNDAKTRQVAEDARQVFLRAWQAAGLEGPKPMKPVAKQASASKQDVPPSAKKQKQSGSSRASGAAAEAPAKPVAEAEPAQPGIDPASCKPEAEVPARFSIEPGVVGTHSSPPIPRLHQMLCCCCTLPQHSAVASRGSGACPLHRSRRPAAAAAG